MKLNENIVHFRKERGLTQEQLANLLDVTVGAVSKWENGNNRPDIELLPVLADVFQISVDALLGYEKQYNDLEQNLNLMEKMLFQEQYDKVIGIAMDILRRYPNEYKVNKILADAFYSKCFSKGMDSGKFIEQAIYYYERCIELCDYRVEVVTKTELYIQIATLYMLDANKIQKAISIIEKYNVAGEYDHLLAKCLFMSDRRKEAKKIMLHHCVANQIFCFNDFTILADFFEKDNDIISAITFLEAELKCYEVFMKEEGGYADRAYAGQAYIISQLYKTLGDEEEMTLWITRAKKHAVKYMQNPSMEISSLKHCEGIDGRMIDNFGKTIEFLLELN